VHISLRIINDKETGKNVTDHFLLGKNNASLENEIMSN
jgi:hypothetical protein